MKSNPHGSRLPPRPRGRPQKFGRPARLVALTLPTDVVAWLETIDRDVGRAVVRLHDESQHTRTRAPRAACLAAELVDVGEGRALIVVDPVLVRGLDGVAAIPFGEGRAFLALKPGGTMADLELTVVDALERGVPGGPERREALREFRERLRGWRTSETLSVDSRAIVVATRKGVRAPGS